MTDCNRKRVSLVRRRRFGIERENHTHHPLDLTLVGSSIATDSLLDTRRCVLGALEPGGRGRDQRGSPCLTDEKRDARIGADKRLLECHSVRLVLGYEIRDIVEDRLQSSFGSLTG